MKVFVDAISVYGQGIKDWDAARQIFSNNAAIDNPDSELNQERYQPSTLPRNERRRATNLIRLAFQLAESIQSGSALDFSKTATVFASSGGDYQVMDLICSILATDEKFISPTHFHNSVHNAAAGYWGIATASHESSTTVSAFDDTFPIGLLEACLYCSVEQKQTLLVAYDIKPDFPLSEKRHITAPFGTAILLQPIQTRDSLVALNPGISDNVDSDTELGSETLRPLLAGNPIARALPLLEAIAVGDARSVAYKTETLGLTIDLVS